MQKFKADSIGPEDMNEPSEVQDFRGFYDTARVGLDYIIIFVKINDTLS